MGVQHRAAKGMGGNPEAERPSNGIVLCNLFNSDMEANAALRELAVAYGWKVSRWDDPATVPVYDALTGAWWLLGDDWSRRRVA